MKECVNCGNEIPKDKKFCDRSCAATYNNKQYPKRTKGREKPKCLGCKTQLDGYNRKYCSNTCQAEYKTNKLLSEWLSGFNHFTKGGSSIPQWMRRHLLDEANHQCSECGWGTINPYTNTIPLDIDHIDGDAYNNLKDNLRVLCPNCHSLKKTFKNAGSRKSTRKNRLDF